MFSIPFLQCNNYCFEEKKNNSLRNQVGYFNHRMVTLVVALFADQLERQCTVRNRVYLCTPNEV